MTAIMIRDSEQPSAWRHGAISGEAVGVRTPSRRLRPHHRQRMVLVVGAIFFTLGVAGGAAAVNIPALGSPASSVGPASSDHAVTPAVAKKVEEPEQHWAFDTNNACKLWSADAIASDITVRWSGRCENSLAQGFGTVRWLSNNKQVAELSGTMEQGKLRGHITGVEEPGNRFDGMYIDSMPEGLGRASFVDGSTYNGQWHRGQQLGYGVMTFPPAYPQYQDMLKDDKGRITDNGIYVLRGWWEGKTFITPCNSEDECEQAVVIMMNPLQDGAGKSGAAVQAPSATPVPAVVDTADRPDTPKTPAAALPTTAPAARPAIELMPAAPGPAPASAPPASLMPVLPEAEPASAPRALTLAPRVSAAAVGGSQLILISDGCS